MVDMSANHAKVRRLVLDAMLVAFHVLWSFVPSEVSWQSLPVLLCAFLIGPWDAMIVATLGSFVEQVQYGISFASVIWMLPWLIFGLFVGLSAFLVRHRPRTWKLVVIIVLSELILNLGNTTALCYFGYLSADFSSAPWVLFLLYVGRLPQALIRGALSAVAVTFLLPPLRQVLSGQKKNAPKDASPLSLSKNDQLAEHVVQDQDKQVAHDFDGHGLLPEQGGEDEKKDLLQAERGQTGGEEQQDLP